MAWSEHLHIHIHDNCEAVLLKILDEVKQIKQCCCGTTNEDVVPQEIMDKLDAAIADIKSTV